MALDVYVGSLTRYYAGDWESIADKKGRRTRPNPTKEARTKAARTRGRRARGEPGKESERIRNAVLAWREGMERALRLHLGETLDWPETADAPWFTGRPGWDGFGSLVLWAAYAEQPGLPRPAVLPEEWDDDPALVRSNADGFRSRYSHLVRNVELWLPAAFEFTFEGEDVDGRRIIVGSSTMLGRQLGELNGATWRMDEGELAALAKTQPNGNSLESSARHAFAVMTGLVRHAIEHRLPMKLDY